ncbi:hypothetical protein D3C72_372450 [compost metagenome]
MSIHHVFQFPNDDEATLEAVLGQTGGIISSPMNDMLLICSTEVEAVFVRCGLGLRPATKTGLLVPVDDLTTVAGWLMQTDLITRCDWAALEHLEFMNVAAFKRTVEVFSDIVGHEPNSLPLNLWPDVFRPNVRTV